MEEITTPPPPPIKNVSHTELVITSIDYDKVFIINNGEAYAPHEIRIITDFCTVNGYPQRYFDYLKEVKTRSIARRIEKDVDTMFSKFPRHERGSWAEQTREAERGGGVFLNTFIEALSVPSETLRNDIIGDSNTIQAYIANKTVERMMLTARVEAATTVQELKAIEV